MKPETIEAVARSVCRAEHIDMDEKSLSGLVNACWPVYEARVSAVLAALTATPEYQEMVKDAELGRAWIWQFSENNDDATPETFRTLRDRTQARADDIDAARNG